MPRIDLLALSLDDLASLKTRGDANKARRQIDEEQCTFELSESPAGEVTVRWSDGPVCTLPAGKPLQQARCTCPANLPPCLHVLRSVLAYQKQAAPAADTVAPPATEPWDPGAIPDEELARFFNARQLSARRTQFDEGLLVELVRASRPSARFENPAVMVRFLVPGDLRYCRCDCGEQMPCAHVPLAVWSFRRLAADRTSGILTTATTPPPAPVETLDHLESALLEFCQHGLSGASSAWKDQLSRLRVECENAGLYWPAEMLDELTEQHERYAGHDARFAPDEVRDLIGELLARSDTIRNDSGALPTLLIRGTGGDRDVSLGKSRFWGLGCGVRFRRRRVILTAYLQDDRTGSLSARCLEFAEPDNNDPSYAPKSFAALARSPALPRTTMAALGVGELVLDGGKRTARGYLEPGRANASLYPPAFTWEKLRPPVFVEEFAELRARLAALPPVSLRSRRVSEDFHVCAVARADGVAFDPTTQTVQAVLLDGRGERARLTFPYTSRGQAGAEALLSSLAEKGANLRFVSGPVRTTPAGLVIEPVCVVFENGGRRTGLQPWIDAPEQTGNATQFDPARTRERDPVAETLARVRAGVEELFVLGLQRADGEMARRWRELQQQLEATGFGRLSRTARGLTDALAGRSHQPHWDARPAARALLELAVVLRLAEDVG